MQLPGNYAKPTRHGEGMSFERFESAPPPDLAAWLEIIRGVRRDGHAMRPGASFEGAVSICAALRPKIPRGPFAVGFTGYNPGDDPGRNAAFGALPKDIIARHSKGGAAQCSARPPSADTTVPVV